VRHVPAQPRALIVVFHGSGGSETFATSDTTQRVLAPFTGGWLRLYGFSLG
jgi:hypothetical protein